MERPGNPFFPVNSLIIKKKKKKTTFSRRRHYVMSMRSSPLVRSPECSASGNGRHGDPCLNFTEIVWGEAPRELWLAPRSKALCSPEHPSCFKPCVIWKTQIT